MPFLERRLSNPTTLSTVASTIYTVPAQNTAIIKQIVVTNTTANAATFNLYIGTASAANAIFSNTTVSGNDSLVINLSQVLNPLEVLTANASANSTLNFTASGVENDGPLVPASVYLANGTVTTSKLADNSVTTAKIAANAVVTADIADNAVTQTKISTDVPLSGFRNIIINGDMRVNQRNSSYTGVGYTLDRWYMGITGAYTVSQSSSSPPTGFQNFMRVQRTNGSSNTGVPQITQSLETRDSIPLQGKTITVSFYARSGSNYSASGNILNWRIYGGTGTDQNVFSYTGQATPVDQSVVLTTSWQRFTYTVSSLTSYNEYGLFFFCVPTGTAGANDYFDITGIQMEIGPQATPFEQRHFGTELILCQRYYYRRTSTASNPYCIIGQGLGYSTTIVQCDFYHPVAMRARCHTLETSSVSNIYTENSLGDARTPSAVTFSTNVSTELATRLDFTVSGATQSRGYASFFNNTSGGYIGVSAEL